MFSCFLFFLFVFFLPLLSFLISWKPAVAFRSCVCLARPDSLCLLGPAQTKHRPSPDRHVSVYLGPHPVAPTCQGSTALNAVSPITDVRLQVQAIFLEKNFLEKGGNSFSLNTHLLHQCGQVFLCDLSKVGLHLLPEFMHNSSGPRDRLFIGGVGAEKEAAQDSINNATLLK